MPHSVDNPAFMRWQEVTASTHLGRAILKTLIKQKRFPAPIRLGHRTVVFSRQAVEAWINGKAEA